jgi:hypothetical protein
MTASLGYPIETRLNDTNAYKHFNSDFVLSNFANSIKNKKFTSVRKALPFYLAILGILASQSKSVSANDQLIPVPNLLVDEPNEGINFCYPSPVAVPTDQCPASSWKKFQTPSIDHVLTEEPIQGFSEEMLNAMTTTEKNLLLSELVKKLLRNDRLLRKCLKDFKASRSNVARFSIYQIIMFGCYCYGRRYLTLKYKLSVTDWDNVKRNRQKLKSLILRKKNLNNSLRNGKVAMVSSSAGIISLTKIELFLCVLTSLTPFQVFITGVSANAATGAVGSFVRDAVTEDGTDANYLKYIEKWVGNTVRSVKKNAKSALSTIAPFTDQYLRDHYQSYRKWPYALDNVRESKMLPIMLYNLTYDQSALTGSEILNRMCQKFLNPKLDTTKPLTSIKDRAWKKLQEDESLAQSITSLQNAILERNALKNNVQLALARANTMRRTDSASYENFMKCLANCLIRFGNVHFDQFVCSVIPQIVESSQHGILTKHAAREFLRMMLRHIEHPDAKNIDVSKLHKTLELCKNGFRII